MKRSSNTSLPIRSKLITDESYGRILRNSSLRRYTGVIMNYIHNNVRALQSEGLQASKRSHAAKDYFEQCLARKNVVYPKRGKFRRLVPILRILDECIRNNDYSGLRLLASVMRSHELSKPNKRFLNAELRDFVSVHIPKPVYRSKEVTKPVPPEVFLTEKRHPLRIVYDEQKTYPDFPWREFLDWLDTSTEERMALARECGGTPPLEASVFSKSSPSKFLVKTKDGNRRFKTAAGSGIADLELAYRMLILYPERGTDPAVKLANELIDFLGLSQSFSYKENFELIKDRDKLVSYLKEEFWYASFNPIAIEANRDYKGRIVHKTAYPLNYPLQWLHEIIMRILERIPGSYAHDHDAGFKAMNRAAARANYLSGIDAKNWTDWMPLCLQFWVLAHYFGTSVALQWVRLMREPASVIVTLEDDSQELIVGPINPGQSMGALSSWAAATLTHHDLYRFSCWRILKDPFVAIKNRKYLSYHPLMATKDPYGVVGDDEFSTNSAVQSDYIMLSDTLGIRMSAQKCKTAMPSEGTYLMEFVHRQTLQGIEVTGLSPILLCDAFASYENLVAFLQFCRNVNFELDEDQLFRSLLRITKSLTRKDYRKKYGVEPIRSSWIDLGLRIPSSMGGLRSNEINWNSYVEPDFALCVMVARIESTVQVYRTLTLRNRTFTRNNEDKILEGLEMLPDDLVNIDQTTVAKYLRKNFNEKYNNAAQRHVVNLIDTFLGEISPVIEKASFSYYNEIDLEDLRKWIEDSLDNLRTIIGVPTYLAAEAEKAVTRSTMFKLVKLADITDRVSWSDRLMKRLYNLKDNIQEGGWVLFGRRPKRTYNRDLGTFYSNLFSSLPED